MKRREFIKAAGLMVAAPGFARQSLFDNENSLHIFHTNDTHSRIDPFPMSDKRNAGMGGMAKRSTVFNQMRKRYKNTLFFDAGDVFQGTPYFNYYEGKLDYMLMSKIGYTAGTLGNHDFDNGVDKLYEAMKSADFDIISSNYAISDSRMIPKVKPYRIYMRSGIKIGVFGLGIDFEGLVTKNNHQGFVYEDPYLAAEKMVHLLRYQEQCHAVICLSHLGFAMRGDVPCDLKVAENIKGIDIIIGGHTHTFMESPFMVNHSSGWTTLIHQVGFGGLRVGHIELYFNKNGQVNRTGAGSYNVG